jgi:hypothetical protein
MFYEVAEPGGCRQGRDSVPDRNRMSLARPDWAGSFGKARRMSTWKGKALEYLPGLKRCILAAQDRQSLWREVEREFHAAVERDDTVCAGACVKYAAWTLHPTPQAKTVVDVSEATARFLYKHADDLHLWIDRKDFMVAHKGLRFHLGDEKYSEFEARFLEKTARYPKSQKARIPSRCRPMGPRANSPNCAAPP